MVWLRLGFVLQYVITIPRTRARKAKQATIRNVVRLVHGGDPKDRIMIKSNMSETWDIPLYFYLRWPAQLTGWSYRSTLSFAEVFAFCCKSENLISLMGVKPSQIGAGNWRRSESGESESKESYYLNLTRWLFIHQKYWWSWVIATNLILA